MLAGFARNLGCGEMPAPELLFFGIRGIKPKPAPELLCLLLRPNLEQIVQHDFG